MKRLYVILYAVFFALMCFTSASAQTPAIQATYSCVNNNATLSVANVSGVTSYTWRNASTSTIEASTATLTRASGSYTVTIIQTSGTSTLGPFTISSPVVPAAPSITPPTDVTTPICASASRSISASGASNYLWKRNNVSLGVSGNSLSVSGTSVAAEGTYSFTVVTVNTVTTCESANSTAVSLKLSPTTPAAPTISGSATFCTGGSTTLTSSTAGSGGSYLWSNNATTSSISVNTAGTYTVKVANSVGCQSASSAGLAVSQASTLPAPTISGSTTFCTGGSTTLTSSSAGTGGSYLWSNGATTASIPVSTAGTYSVKITNSLGCESAFSAGTVVTQASSLPTPTISGTPSFCAGSSTTLTASSAGTGGTYLWNNGATTQSIIVSSVGSYSVQIGNGAGCFSSSSTSVSVSQNTVPNAPSITGTASFCTGSNTILTCSSAGIGGSYLWSNGSTTQSITVTTGGNYSVQVISSAGCTSPATSIFVTEKATPSPPTISGSSTYCPNGSTTLTASSAGTGGTYLWSNNATTQSITVSTPSTHSVRVTNSLGCQSASSTAVNVTQSSTPAAPTITGITAFCSGDSTILTSSSAGTGGTYLWNNGATTPSIVVRTAGIFNVKTFSSAGCTSATSLNTTTTVNPLPSTPTITGVNTICSGDSSILTSSSAGTGTYLWSNNKTTASIVVKTAGSYSVRTISTLGCYSASSTPFNLTVNTTPSKPVITGIKTICAGDSSTLTSSNNGAGTYLWNNNKTTASIVVKTAGKYAVRVTSALGCKSPSSDTLIFTVNPLPATPTLTSNFSTFCATSNAATLQSSYATGYNIWNRSNQSSELATGLNVRSLSVSDTNTYTVSTITVKVKAQDAVTGCLSPYSNSIVLTINPTPQKPTIFTQDNRFSFCDRDSLRLTAISRNSVTSYSWNNSRSGQTIYVKTGSNYNVTVTNVYGCNSLVSDNVGITVNPLPSKPTISAMRPLEFCQLDFTSIRADPVESYTANYIWSTGQTALTVDYNYTQTGISAIAVSNQGCKSIESSNVLASKMFPRPTTPSITASGPLEFCPDKTVSFTANTSPKGYVWYFNKVLLQDSVKQKITVSKAGIYGLQTTSPGPFNGSCYSVDTAKITTKVLDAPLTPSIFARSSTTFCDGGQVILEALAANVNVVKYSWQDEATKQEYATTANITLTKSGKYSLKVIDNRTCFSAYSEPVAVKVNALPKKPSIIAIRPKMFCLGDSTILQSSLPTTTPDSSSNKYNWVVDNTPSTIRGRSISLKTSNIVSVSLVDANGCVSIAASDTAKTTVNPLPVTPYITVVGSNPFCADQSITLNASDDAGYKWSTGATSKSIQVNKVGSYSVQTLNKYNCLSKASTPIVARVNALPAATSIVAQGYTTFCNGDSVKLAAQSSLTSYWYLNNTDSLGRSKSGSIFTAFKGGKYSVRVQDSNGCLSPQSSTVTIDARALPSSTPSNTILPFGPFSLEAPIIGDANGYEWKLNDKVQTNYITKIIKAAQDGKYQVRGSITYTAIPLLPNNKLVCYSPWSLVKDYVEDATYEGLSIYPNPSNTGDFWIQTSEDLYGAEISVYDILGRLLYTETVNEFTTAKKVSVTAFSGSSFIIKVKNAVYSNAKRVFVIQ